MALVIDESTLQQAQALVDQHDVVSAWDPSGSGLAFSIVNTEIGKLIIQGGVMSMLERIELSGGLYHADAKC